MVRFKETLLTPVEFYRKMKTYRSNPKMETKYEERAFYENFYQ